jgi:hypothetical protein
MPRLRTKKVLFGLNLTACLLVAVAVVIAVTPRNKDVIDEDAGSGMCSCSIGGASSCNGSGGEDYWGTTVSWHTDCGSSSAFGYVDCPDGTRVECRTDYSVDADQSGLTCRETGSYSYSIYCTL